MSGTPTAKEFLRLRNKLGLSIQDVAFQMRNVLHFNTLNNFEHGMTVSEDTKKQIKKWIDSKKNLVIKKP